MRDVVAAINAQVQSMVADNIIFKFLNDESISAEDRLRRLAPRFASFVLGFHDLQSLVLKYPAEEAKLDRIKKAINAHCTEDSNHWPWFLTDLKTLGVDKEMTYTSAIKFLWSKDTRQQRSACYQFAILADRASDPILRFVYLLAFELNGLAVFSKFLELATKYQIETGKELLYFGPTHFERETGSLHGEEEIENELLAMELGSDVKTEAIEIAMKVLEIQDTEWSELGKVAYANKKW